ncbi:superkiller complex protein 8-like isoform X2 [Drosophila tropicalis]|uniref:superkiller complex protein 8-like isoform X2 n=1 Tax=Drosophila tropicalis TaxID=46794 RepID=UPI0035AB8DEC
MDQHIRDNTWTCVCGLIDTTNDGKVDDKMVIYQPNGSETENEEERQFLEQNYLPQHMPRQFIAIGGGRSEIKISEIVADEDFNVFFPLLYEHPVPSLGIHDMALTTDSKTIAAVSVDGLLSIVDVKQGVRFESVGKTIRNFWSVAFDPKGKFVYAGNGTGCVYKFMVDNGHVLQEYNSQRMNTILCVCPSTNGGYVASGDFDGWFTLYDGATSFVLKQIHFKKALRSIIFAEYLSIFLAACDDHSVKIVHVQDFDTEPLMGHRSRVVSLDPSPDGRQFTSGSTDGVIKVWDARCNKCSITFTNREKFRLWDLAFAKSNNLVAYVSSGKDQDIYFC